jgi:hypothetical protein
MEVAQRATSHQPFPGRRERGGVGVQAANVQSRGVWTLVIPGYDRSARQRGATCGVGPWEVRGGKEPETFDVQPIGLLTPRNPIHNPQDRNVRKRGPDPKVRRRCADRKVEDKGQDRNMIECSRPNAGRRAELVPTRIWPKSCPKAGSPKAQNYQVMSGDVGRIPVGNSKSVFLQAERRPECRVVPD